MCYPRSTVLHPSKMAYHDMKFVHKSCGEIRSFAKFGGILHMTNVKKSEIYPVFGCEISFSTIYTIVRVICFVIIYALLRGEKLSPNLYRWRKNDKYEVSFSWTMLRLLRFFGVRSVSRVVCLFVCL